MVYATFSFSFPFGFPFQWLRRISVLNLHRYFIHLLIFLQEEGYQSDQAVGALTAQKQQEVGTPEMVKLSRRRYEDRSTQLSE